MVGRRVRNDLERFKEFIEAGGHRDRRLAGRGALKSDHAPAAGRAGQSQKGPPKPEKDA